MKPFHKLSVLLLFCMLLFGISSSLWVEAAPPTDFQRETSGMGVIGAQVLAAPDASGIFSDDFNDFNLDTSIWTIVDPVGDATISFTGTNTTDAWLNLGVSQGIDHDVWDAGNRAPRIMQSANNTDFEIEVKFENLISERYQLYGIVIEESPGNYLRFDFFSDGNGVNIFSAIFTNDTHSSTSSAAITPGAPLWMRITRTGDDFTQSYSYDGLIFTDERTLTHSMTVSQVGVFVGNAPDGSSPAHMGQIDYFFNTAARIDPEDGETGVVDDSGPNIFNLEAGASDVQAAISWSTDELATGLVEYGTDTNYNEGAVSLTEFLASQTAILNGLTPDTEYLYRVTATDANSNSTVVDNLSFTTGDQPGGEGPIVDIWYGDTQTYTIGRAQEWCNVLGHVEDADGISAMSYSLNGGADVPLAVEGYSLPGVAGSPRLQNTGDFNVEIDCDDLQSGSNQVIISAVDNAVLPNTTTRLVTLEYDPNAYWPETYNVDWSTLTSIEEISSVAHVVDGKWELFGGGLRTAEPGYDRLVAIGDVAWDDYEVLVPITFNGGLNGGAGILMRWNGHTDDPTAGTQPHTGYYPLGAIGWMLNGQLQFYTNRDGTPSNPSVTVESGDQIMLRMRVTTLPNGAGFYQIRIWEVGTTEPTDWQLEYTADQQGNDPTNGSLMLIVHQIDVTFGNVEITPIIPPDDETPPVITDVDVTPSDTTAYIDWTTDELATSIVNFGLDTNYGETVQDLALTTSHELELTDLQSNTTYFYEITSADANENAASFTGSFMTTAEPLDNTIESDDFNTCELDPIWRFEDAGFGNASYELVGGGSGEAILNLTVTADQSIDAWNPAGPPRMVQDIPPAAAEADFQVEAKFNSIPQVNYHDQGLVLWEDASNWIRYDVYHTGSIAKVFVGQTTSGVTNTVINATVPAGIPPYLRVTRTGNQWTFEYSADGATWTPAATITRNLSMTEIGLYGANPFGGDYTASVDYFFDTDSRIDPEDADLNTITVTPNGSGTVSLNPDQASYACGEVVEITPIPESGWSFDGWTGDITSSDNPLMVTIEGDLNLNANFVEDSPTEITLSGSVSFEGRTGDQTNTVDVTIYATGTDTIIGTFPDVATDSAGDFSVVLTGVAPGTYDAAVKETGWLQEMLYSQTMSAGSNVLSFDQLLAGDLDDDNEVSFLDFSGLILSYELSDGDANYLAAADFNGNGTVDFLDFSGLVNNYGLFGDEPIDN